MYLCKSKNLAFIRLKSYAEISVLNDSLCAVDQTCIGFSIQWLAYAKLCRLVVVVDGNDNAFLSQNPGKSILSVCQQKLLISAFGESRLLLVDFSQSLYPLQQLRILRVLQGLLQINCRPQRIVVGSLFSSLDSPFGSIINGGNTRKSIQKGMDRINMSRHIQL